MTGRDKEEILHFTPSLGPRLGETGSFQSAPPGMSRYPPPPALLLHCNIICLFTIFVFCSWIETWLLMKSLLLDDIDLVDKQEPEIWISSSNPRSKRNRSAAGRCRNCRYSDKGKNYCPLPPATRGRLATQVSHKTANSYHPVHWFLGFLGDLTWHGHGSWGIFTIIFA